MIRIWISYNSLLKEYYTYLYTIQLYIFIFRCKEHYLKNKRKKSYIHNKRFVWNLNNNKKYFWTFHIEEFNHPSWHLTCCCPCSLKVNMKKLWEMYLNSKIKHKAVRVFFSQSINKWSPSRVLDHFCQPPWSLWTNKYIIGA